MRVFFATSHTEKYVGLLQKEGVQNVLFSYAFFKSPTQTRKIFQEFNPRNLIIDSGAFSVWTRGEEVDIDQYAHFCGEIKKLFPLCNIYVVNLDVLPGKFGQRPTQKQVEEAVRFFDYDSSRAYYLDIENRSNDMLIFISKVNYKVFLVPVKRGGQIYNEGKAKYSEMAFRWWTLFGDLKL